MAHLLQKGLILLCAASAAAFAQHKDLKPGASCAPCHPQPAAGKRVKFNHATHAKFGNVAPVIAAAIDRKTYLSPPGDLRKQLDTKNPCAACHRGVEGTAAIAQANFPHMADCLVCHSKIDPPYSCAKCHLPETQLKPADHAPDFVDVHSDAKLAKAGCAVCHGRRFTCMGCH